MGQFVGGCGLRGRSAPPYLPLLTGGWASERFVHSCGPSWALRASCRLPVPVPRSVIHDGTLRRWTRSGRSCKAGMGRSFKTAMPSGCSGCDEPGGCPGEVRPRCASRSPESSGDEIQGFSE